MDDLISRKAAIDSIKDPVVKGFAMYGLKNVPAVDAVPVVRCRDCIYNPQKGYLTEKLPYWLPCKQFTRDKNWYCADGKRGK